MTNTMHFFSLHYKLTYLSAAINPQKCCIFEVYRQHGVSYQRRSGAGRWVGVGETLNDLEDFRGNENLSNEQLHQSVGE